MEPLWDADVGAAATTAAMNPLATVRTLGRHEGDAATGAKGLSEVDEGGVGVLENMSPLRLITASKLAPSRAYTWASAWTNSTSVRPAAVARLREGEHRRRDVYFDNRTTGPAAKNSGMLSRVR